MKQPSIAPAYAFLYPILCEAARAKGYALGMHGTLQRDLDVIAVPWTEDAASTDDLVAAIKQACDGFIFGAPEDPNDVGAPYVSPAHRPHGRLAWSIYITDRVYVDLSVMPRLPISGEEVSPQ